MSGKTALMILAAEGAEEMEVVITADVLARGGVKVLYAGLSGNGAITCAKGTKIVPNVALEEVKGTLFDVVILPGGQPGSNTLAASEMVGNVLKAHYEASRLVAAICAAPIALKKHGIKADLVTSHPCVKDVLESGGYKYSEDSVVVSGNIVTSRGPGTCFEFALKLVALLVGQETSDSLRAPMMLGN